MKPHKMIRILIADDHHLFRQGLVKLIEETISRPILLLEIVFPEKLFLSESSKRIPLPLLLTWLLDMILLFDDSKRIPRNLFE